MGRWGWLSALKEMKMQITGSRMPAWEKIGDLEEARLSMSNVRKSSKIKLGNCLGLEPGELTAGPVKKNSKLWVFRHGSYTTEEEVLARVIEQKYLFKILG